MNTPKNPKPCPLCFVPMELHEPLKWDQPWEWVCTNKSCTKKPILLDEENRYVLKEWFSAHSFYEATHNLCQALDEEIRELNEELSEMREQLDHLFILVGKIATHDPDTAQIVSDLATVIRK